MPFLFAVLVVIADQLTKTWIRASLEIGDSLFEFGIFRIVHVSNTGAAFGILPGLTPLLIVARIIGLTVLVLVAAYWRRIAYLESRLNRAALGLVMGGTAGNLIDSIRLGHVTDFIDFTYWPAFNIADSGISVGVAIFAFSLLRIWLKKD